MAALLACALAARPVGAARPAPVGAPRHTALPVLVPRHAAVVMKEPGGSGFLDLFFGKKPTPQPRCSTVLRELFGTGVIDPSAVAARCSDNIEWIDMSSDKAAKGPAEVKALLQAKFQPGSGLMIERLSDGDRSGGFTWHRVARGREGEGLRGTLYVELDIDGKISFVQEGCEPLFKAGELTEAILKAATSSAKKPPKPPPTFTPRSPSSASEIVRYLWIEAYPGGAESSEALRFFAEDIVYEDFNYASPFIGLPAVTEFINSFDIPGIQFVLSRCSEGSIGCCFTWALKVNEATAVSGISYYEVAPSGRVCFVRDIPGPAIKPPPLLTLASIKDPQLLVFTPRPPKREDSE